MPILRPFNNRKKYSYVREVDFFDNEFYMNKLKEEFISNISHELKTPLTIILGYAQLLKDEKYSSSDSFLIAIDYIESEGKKLNNLFDDLIEKSRNSKI